MRSEELVRWTTIGVSCAVAIQLALFVLPGLRGPIGLLQIVLALGACGALAYIVTDDRRHDGELTRGQGRDQLKMIGMFLLLWLTFAVAFRMLGIGAVAPTSAPSAVAPKSNNNQYRERDRDMDYNNFGRLCRGSYCVYEEWYY
ncbi:hypothetical protein RhiJN_15650 [Ceratobasidium sp. AG-Ba]|nr:hypothetical protein RhiJN_15650 [Ceratobasidium sp. AG-Ba]